MENKRTLQITLEVSEEDIEPGDLFYFEQSSGLPVIMLHQGRKGEDWNGFTNSKTGERSYLKITSIKGVILRTFNYNDEPLMNNNP